MRDARRCEALAWLALLAVAAPAARAAEPLQPSPPATAPGIYRLDFGMLLRADAGSFKNVQGTVTVPADWPQQQRVRTVKQRTAGGHDQLQNARRRRPADGGPPGFAATGADAGGRHVRG